MRAGLIAIVLMMCAGLLSICTKSSADVLTIYSSFDVAETEDYMRHYEESTGESVKWVRLSTGEALARLKAERHSPQASVWFGGTTPEFIMAAEDGLLEGYRPKNMYDLDLTQRDVDYRWMGIYFGAIGFGSNTEMLKELGVEPPESWQDLLDPKLKGQISMAFPYTSGTAYTLVASVLQLMGEDAGFEYFERLNNQIHHYNKSGSAAVTQAGIGEIAVGLSFSHDILRKGKSAGYPIKLTFPTEGTGYETGAMALVKGGGQPEKAKRFMDFYATAEGQKVLIHHYRVPLNPDVEIPDTVVSRDQVKLADFDAEAAAKAQKRIIERWKTSVE